MTQRKDATASQGQAPQAPGGGLLRGLAEPRILGLLLVVVTFVVFWPVSGFDFIGYDDPEYVASNPVVLDGLTLKGLGWAFTTFHAGNWHPITWLSLMADVQFIGADPAALHIVNLLFHLANTVLLFGLLLRLTGAVWRSAFAAALFAVHPLHVESVAWISERKDVLSTLFLLLTLWFYARGVRLAREKAVGAAVPACAPTSRPCLLSLGFFVLGLLSKPMLVTVPFLLLLLDYWPLERIADLREALRWRTLWLLLREKWAFFLLSMGSCVITVLAQQRGGAIRSLATLPFGARLENAVVSYVSYLWKAVWPTDLAIFYPHPADWPTAQVALAALVLGVLTTGVLWFNRKLPSLFTGWFWYLGTLVPVIGLVQVGIQSMADRYTYLPLIGIFVGVAWGAGAVVSRLRPPRLVVAVPACALVAACAVAAHVQVGYWRDDERLFGHAAAATQNNALAHNNLADYLLRRHRFEEAVTHYREVVQINPEYVHAWHNQGIALSALGKDQEAIPCFEKAIALDPRFVNAHVGLADVLLALGRTQEALSQYRAALGIAPDYLPALNNYSQALMRAGQGEEAIEVYRRILTSHPNLPAAHLGLATILLQEGKRALALQHVQEALRLQPDLPRAQELLRQLQSSPSR